MSYSGRAVLVGGNLGDPAAFHNCVEDNDHPPGGVTTIYAGGTQQKLVDEVGFQQPHRYSDAQTQARDYIVGRVGNKKTDKILEGVKQRIASWCKSNREAITKPELGGPTSSPYQDMLERMPLSEREQFQRILSRCSRFPCRVEVVSAVAW